MYVRRCTEDDSEVSNLGWFHDKIYFAGGYMYVNTGEY